MKLIYGLGTDATTTSIRIITGSSKLHGEWSPFLDKQRLFESKCIYG